MRTIVCFVLCLVFQLRLTAAEEAECKQRLLSRTGNPCQSGYIRWLSPQIGHAVPGKDIIVKAGLSIRECRELCWSIPGCKSIEFQNDNNCYINSVSGPVEEAGGFTYQTFECCNEDNCARLCQVMETAYGPTHLCDSNNVRWLDAQPGYAVQTGHEITTLPGQTLISCQRLCYDHPECQAAHLSTDATCTLNNASSPMVGSAYNSFLGFECCAPVDVVPEPTPTPKNDTKCDTIVDLGFILDASFSIGEDNFNENLKETVKSIINLLLPGDGDLPSKSRVGVVTFDTKAHLQFNVIDGATKNEILADIDAIEYPSNGLTAIGDGLNLFTTTIVPNLREHVPKIVVWIGDGEQTSGKRKALDEAPLLHSQVDVVYAIGVGDSINSETLEVIASDPQFAILVEDYESMLEQLSEFSATVCDNIETFERVYDEEPPVYLPPDIDDGPPLVDDYDESPPVYIDYIPPPAETTFLPPIYNDYYDPDDYDYPTPSPNYDYNDYIIPPDNTCDLSSTIDLGFILDASFSIGEDNFNYNLKETVKSIIDKMLPGDGNLPSKSRVGVVTFDTKAHLQFNVIDGATKNEILADIDAIEYPSNGLTAIGDGLNLFTTTIVPNLRADVPKVVVWIGDGEQTSGKRKSEDEAPLLHSLVDVVYAIGVGDSINDETLQIIASKPEYAIMVEDYESLAVQLSDFSKLVCDKIETLEEPNTPPPEEYDPPSDVYDPPSDVYDPPSDVYDPPSDVYDPPSDVYDPPSDVYDPPSDVYDPPSEVYDPPTTDDEAIPPQPENKCEESSIVDLGFILDASFSIGEDNFNYNLKETVKSIIDQLLPGDGDLPSQSRVGVVTFDTKAHLQFNVINGATKNEILADIDAIAYPSNGLTAIGDGLNLFTTTIVPNLRADVPKIVVWIGDGEQTSGKRKSEDEAPLLHSLVDVVYAIGVGESINDETLQIIASKPEYAILVEDYESMQVQLSGFSSLVCDRIETLEKTYVDVPEVLPPPTEPPVVEEERPEACQNLTKFDLAFVLDASFSIGEDNFNENLKGVVKNIISQLLPEDGSAISASRVGVVTFYDDAFLDFNLDTYQTKEEILNAVENIEYPENGLTALGQGLFLTRTKVASIFRAAVPKIVIFIGDGNENVGQHKYRDEAPLLRKTADIVYAIGVGNKIERNILDVIATTPQYSLMGADYESLLEQLADFGARICNDLKALHLP